MPKILCNWSMRHKTHSQIEIQMTGGEVDTQILNKFLSCQLTNTKEVYRNEHTLSGAYILFPDAVNLSVTVHMKSHLFHMKFVTLSLHVKSLNLWLAHQGKCYLCISVYSECNTIC